MESPAGTNEFRFEKRRAAAVVTMVGGEVARGSFFTAGDTTRRFGGERVADLLNSEAGFFPFEVEGTGQPRTVLYNRAHLISAEIFDNEPKDDPDYDVASRRPVSILLSNGCAGPDFDARPPCAMWQIQLRFRQPSRRPSSTSAESIFSSIMPVLRGVPPRKKCRWTGGAPCSM